VKNLKKGFNDQLIFATSGIRSVPRFSSDGITWSELKNPCSGIYSRVESAFMVTDNEAYILCSHTGMISVSTSLKKTVDKGVNWTDLLKEDPVYSLQVFYADGMIFYNDLTSTIYVSKDDGKSWQIDRLSYQ
jgi:hypothetical protein